MNEIIFKFRCVWLYHAWGNAVSAILLCRNRNRKYEQWTSNNEIWTLNDAILSLEKYDSSSHFSCLRKLQESKPNWGLLRVIHVLYIYICTSIYFLFSRLWFGAMRCIWPAFSMSYNVWELASVYVDMTTLCKIEVCTFRKVP